MNIHTLHNFPVISNWKEVVDKFGIDKAKELSKQLRDHNAEGMLIEINPKTSEFCAIFEYNGFINNKHVFTYTGVVN